MTFSVIIPVYNVAPYLRECLDSVCVAVQELGCRVGVGERTEYPFAEVICVDDGSTDGSGELLDEIVGEMSGSGSGTAELKSSVPLSNSNSSLQLKVIHQRNAGVSAARNAGIEAAHGDWLLFVDGDDLLRADAFACLVSAIGGNPDVDLIRFGYEAFEVEPRKSADGSVPAGYSSRIVDISKRIAFEDIYSYMWQFSYRRSMVGDLRFDRSYHRMEDRPFVCRCLMFKCDKFLSMDASLYGYRQRPGSAMHRQPSTETWSGEIRYRVQLMDWADKCGREIPKFAQSDWICGFFMRTCIDGIAGRSAADQAELYAEWFKALKFLSRRTDLLRSQKILFTLAAICPCRIWTDVLFLYPLRIRHFIGFRTRLRRLRDWICHG